MALVGVHTASEIQGEGNEGVVKDCLTPEGQMRTDLIPKFRHSYRVAYTKRVIDLADRAQAGKGDGLGPGLPPLGQWSFAQVRRARAKSFRLQERQTSHAWTTLAQFNIPPKLHHFILPALWRKLPVAARMFSFKMLASSECLLCGLTDCHLHALK